MFVDTGGLLGPRPPTIWGHWLCRSVSNIVSVAPQTPSRKIVFVTTCTLVVWHVVVDVVVGGVGDGQVRGSRPSPPLWTWAHTSPTTMSGTNPPRSRDAPHIQDNTTCTCSAATTPDSPCKNICPLFGCLWTPHWYFNSVELSRSSILTLGRNVIVFGR